MFSKINSIYITALAFNMLLFILSIFVSLLFFIVFFLELVWFFYDKKAFLVFFYPILEFFSKILRINDLKFKKDFINISNKLNSKNLKKTNNVLLLIPHCLQDANCKYRITSDNIDNCKKCKKCKISDFIDIKNKYNLDVIVVTGGTLARKYIKERKPDFLLAVACENDLVSGIRDLAGVPVIGVLNKRPNGPCFNTDVDVKEVLNNLNMVLSK
jgi:uncharacterized protein